MADTKPRVGYWAIRGLVAPIRTLLVSGEFSMTAVHGVQSGGRIFWFSTNAFHGRILLSFSSFLQAYCGVDHTFDSFEQGDAPDFSRDAWLREKAKFSGELDFPNLPYFIDGDVKITQSSTILRYVARKYGSADKLYDGTAEELATIDCCLDQVVDLRASFVRTSYGGMAFSAFAEGILPSFLAGFEAVLSKPGREFLAGSRLTIADFAFAEVLDGIQAMVAELSEEKGKQAFASYPAIAAYKARVEALPKIAAFRSSPSFMARPFNNKVAVWR